MIMVCFVESFFAIESKLPVSDESKTLKAGVAELKFGELLKYNYCNKPNTAERRLKADILSQRI